MYWSCSKEAAFNPTSITSKHIEQKLVQKSHASACGEGKLALLYWGGEGGRQRNPEHTVLGSDVLD